MANYCSTQITISGEESDIDILYLHLERALKYAEKQNKDWLGNILCYLGEDPENYSCRGCVIYMEKQNESIIIDTETAWVPMLVPFRLMIDKYAPEVDMVYTAEELGTGIFCTNDPAEDEYYIDAFYYEGDDNFPANLVTCESYLSKRELYKELVTATNRNGSMEDLIQELQDEFEHFRVYEMEYVEESNWG